MICKKSIKTYALLLLLTFVHGVQASSPNTSLSALHEACEKVDIEAVRLLLTQDADVNAQDAFGFTPLHIAISNQSYEMTKLLLMHGADPTIKIDGSAHNSLQFSQGSLDCIEEIVHRYYWINLRKASQNDPRYTPVTKIQKLFRGHKQPQKFAKMKVRALNLALQCATREGNLTEIEYLILEKKADINAQTDPEEITPPDNNKSASPFTETKSPLHYATRNNNRNAVSLLIKLGAHVNAQDINDTRALHFAALYNFYEIASDLIDAGADVNARDNKGWTPLHYAVNGKFHQMATMLMESGADKNTENEKGQTPLDLITPRALLPMLQLLVFNSKN